MNSPMQRLLIPALLFVGLSACGGNDSRYRDTQMLERPPALPITKQDEAIACCPDDAAIPKKSNQRGLGDDVELVATRPMTLKIKQPFDTAWNNIALALGQIDIKITDQERKQGIYYVAYQPASLFGSWLSLGKDAIYQLIVKQDTDTTTVSAELANTTEQNGSPGQFESDIEEARADAEDLLYRLYETLRDDLVSQ